MSFSDNIKIEAKRLGFDACGISKATSTDQELSFHKWLEKNYHASMYYMERNIDKRMDPAVLVEGAKSIISVALNYYPPQLQSPDVPQFAYYAYGKDYHYVVKDKLYALYNFIKDAHPNASGRCFTDSAPVMERYWAAKAGIGFIGKNSLLIIPKLGSFFFLGEIVIDIELDYDTSINNNCGSCTRCIDACPNTAIVEPYVIDSNRCISYQTIENRGDIPDSSVLKLNNCVFGCDICQKVCPWNANAKPNTTPDFFPSDNFLSLDKDRLINLSEPEFKSIFKDSAVQRTKYNGLKRNILAVSEIRNK